MELKSRVHRLGKEFTCCRQETNSCYTKLQHPLIEQFKKKSSLIINLDLENRAKVNQILLNRLLVE